MLPDTPSSHGDLARLNRRAVLRQVVLHPPATRTTLAEVTGLTGASVSRITRELIEAGLIAEHPMREPTNRMGRRTVDLMPNSSGGYLIGIAINAFSQQVTLSDLNNEVTDEIAFNAPALADPAQTLAAAAAATRQLLDENKVPRARLLAVGVSIAGSVNPSTGVVRRAPTLGWEDVPVRDVLAKEFPGTTVVIETYPHTLMWAETHFGAAKGHRDVVLLNASLGVGGSIFLDGEIRRGRNFAAGMLGNLRPTRCLGRNDIPRDQLRLDDVGAGYAVLKALGRRSHTRRDASDARQSADALLRCAQAASDGDEQVCEAFYRAGRFVGDALEMLTVALQPELLIVSGPVATVGAYQDGVRDALSAFTQDDEALACLHFSQLAIGGATTGLALAAFLASFPRQAPTATGLSDHG